MTHAPQAVGDLLDAALALIHAGRLAEAESTLNTFLASNPATPDVGRAHILLGEIADIRGDLAAALRHYNAGLDYLPITLAAARARAFRMLARTLHMQGFFERASDAFAQAELLLGRIDTPRLAAKAQLEHRLLEATLALADSDKQRATEAAKEAKTFFAHLATLKSSPSERARGTGKRSESDAVTEGLFLQVVGLVEAANNSNPTTWGNLLDRAVQHFSKHGLVYHHARALDAVGRAYATCNLNFGVDKVRHALELYEQMGARFLADRARDTVAQWESVDRSLGGTPVEMPAAISVDYSADRFHRLTNTGHFVTELIPRIVELAQYNTAILITGETGTGKELVADAIHRESPRAAKPFIPVNASAITPERFVADFFGARKGSFSGQEGRIVGSAEAADGGTLFIDEIGDLPLDVQPQLLRFLESGEIRVLGEPAPKIANVRVVAATNRDLAAKIADGSFRDDLYHRLTRGGHLHLRPLRERKDEIRIFAREFANDWARQTRGEVFVWFTEQALRHLEQHPWRGNIRELKNYIESVLVRFSTSQSELRVDLPMLLQTPFVGATAIDEDPALADPSEIIDSMAQQLSALGWHVTQEWKSNAASYLRRQREGHSAPILQLDEMEHQTRCHYLARILIETNCHIKDSAAKVGRAVPRLYVALRKCGLTTSKAQT